MNDQPPTPPTSDGGLQFEHAEYASPAASRSCVVCKQPITDSYYQVNDKSICPSCREQIEKTWTGGSGVARFGRATIFGAVAGILGAAIWYAIAATTGYELGLIAILVGFMVGWAVRRGANARGGWLYQALAILLTYTAIVSTYIPPLLKEFRNAASERNHPTVASTNAVVKTAQATEPAQPAADQKLEVPLEQVGRSGPGGLVGWAVAGVVVFAIAFMAPFLAGFENFIGWIIIAIACYEAWKLNKRALLQITGPFQIGATAVPPAA
ncbi:MAG: hypothetical protein HY298_03450 [Verrucomicrobia bacterium]|nr:hypothetical protein [Verrucomicrobiota bacterium]